MAEIQGFADAHLHIVDVERQGGYPDIENASLLLSCTSSFDQWEEQRKMGAADSRIFPFYGIHPWFVSTAPSNYIDLLDTFLKRDERSGVGEIGIDKTHPALDVQMEMFNAQMEVANEFERPVTIHMVGTETETLKVIKDQRMRVPVILHSYSGPDSYIGAFSKQECYFSISPRILQKSEIRIMRLLSAIPDDRLLIETDAPIRSRNCNDMAHLIKILAGFKSITASELITITKNNTMRVIS